ncbi:MAG: isoprenyl transferase [Erysipelotrichaceae bacterium]|nr:isoprenyl transferase [Erysipelotrichaceae bacterium]
MNVKHLAIIMDGNGRWAKARGKVRTEGHFKGVEVVRDAAIAANDLGVEVLTLYAFSTENWKRSADEVGYLMKLPALFFNRFLKELMEKNIRIAMTGEMDQIPADTAKVLTSAIEETKNNTGMVLNFAMNYGSQREIVLAARKYAEEVLSGKRANDLEVDQFDQYLMTSEFPPVDLMIRTSGECRLSNFLLWQLAYAELEFIDLPWPEFTAETLKERMEQFKKRDRRFGGVKG